MADKPAFIMAEKQLLIKLHMVAVDDLKLNEKEYILINSGFSTGGKIDLKKNDYSNFLQQDPTKIKFFETKANMYEVGIAVTVDGIKTQVPSFSALSAEGTPEELYAEVKNNFGAADIDKIKDIAYENLVKYMTSFCGEKYAKSIPKDKVKCMAFPTIDMLEIAKDGVIADCDKKYKTAAILLYKIGYTVGSSK